MLIFLAWWVCDESQDENRFDGNFRTNEMTLAVPYLQHLLLSHYHASVIHPNRQATRKPFRIQKGKSSERVNNGYQS